VQYGCYDGGRGCWSNKPSRCYRHIDEVSEGSLSEEPRAWQLYPIMIPTPPGFLLEPCVLLACASLVCPMQISLVIPAIQVTFSHFCSIVGVSQATMHPRGIRLPTSRGQCETSTGWIPVGWKKQILYGC
jgi:hypothetical protein